MQQSQQAAESGAKVREIKENVQELTGGLRKKASNMADDAIDNARIYYSEARIWMRRNYGKVLAVAGGLAAIGLTTFFILRRRNKEDLEM